MTRLWNFSDLRHDRDANSWGTRATALDFDVAVVAADVHSPLTNAVGHAEEASGLDPSLTNILLDRT